jgi:hypothetical protein
MRIHFLLAACVVVAACLTQQSHAEDAPGLLAEYFKLGSAPGDFVKLPGDAKPFFVRIDKTVNFPDVAGDFYGIKLADNFCARWTGTLKIEKAGSYQFFCTSDDGSRLSIDNKTVVSNGGSHPMQEESGKIDLQPGDHQILIEYYEGGGESGCVVEWLPAGGKREVLSEKALFHKKGAEEAVSWDKATWEKNPKGASEVKNTGATAAKGGKVDRMDYGPFITGTIESAGNLALKGMAIKLTKDTFQAPPEDGKEPGKMAAICFDPDEIRFAFAWTDGYLKMPTGRDGIEGHPSTVGNVAFSIKRNSPGWSKTDDFKDPRPKPFGPLPHAWGHYKGTYINGDKVVVSYTVGDTLILDQPGFAVKDGADIFSRTISIAKSSCALTMLICEKDKSKGNVEGDIAILDAGNDKVIAAGVSGAPAGAALNVTAEGAIQLKIPALTAPANFTVYISNLAKADTGKLSSAVKSAEKPADLSALTKGGPARFTPEIELKGTIGTGDAAYVQDEITVPYENPWKSYMRITGMDFFADGRAIVSTMSGDLWLVSGIDKDLEHIKWKRYASGLFQSLGVKIVNDEVYALCRGELTRFHDYNKDGEADFYEAFNNDGQIGNNYHEFAHDLHTDTEGNFYYMRGSNLGSNGTPQNGCMIRVLKDGSKSEIVSHGYRAPNGMCVGPKNQMTTGDNQGNWIPASPINWVYPPDSPVVKKEQLSFSGFRLDAYPYTKTDVRTDPLVWIPYGEDNSCGGQVWAGEKWGPSSGHLLHMSYGKCKLFQAMIEKQGDYMRGAVYKYPLNFISGVMRARVSAIDGQLYCVGMRGWQTSANKDGCFTRVRYTGKPAHMPVESHLTKTGFEITFTDSLDPASAGDAQNWNVEAFNVIYTGDYGSPEYSVASCNEKNVKPYTYETIDKKVIGSIKKGHDNWTVKTAKVSPEGKTVSLEIEGLQQCTNMLIKYKVKFADGTAVTQEVDTSVHRLP